MQLFKTVTLAYCVACISCGVLRELMPEENSRNVIKALSGLYILLLILHGAREQNWNFTLPQLEMEPQPESYQQSVQQQAEITLSQNCAVRFASAGIDATANFSLREEDQTVLVASVFVTSPTALTQQEKHTVETILAEYEPGTILYQIEEDGDG